MVLRVAGAQIPVTRDVSANLWAIERGIEFAAARGADILLTPEGSLSGYTHLFDRVAVSEALTRVVAWAREAGIGLALGTCYVEPSEDRCYNQIRFYAPDGTYLGFHGKTLLCGSLASPPQGEINHYAATDLRTFSLAGVTVGGLICNDLWANPGCTPMPDPHLLRQLSAMGARVVFHAVNGGRDGSAWSKQVVWAYHSTNLRMRAQAAGVWVVTVDSCSPLHLPCSAPSGVVSPSGDWVCRTAPQGEQFFVYTIQDVS
jgi:predicted amidohydrolase